MTMRNLTTETFDEAILASAVPVLVEFSGAWCGPCHQIEPVLVRLAAELEGRVDIATIDFDDHPDVGRRFEVMSLPTLILFVDGRPVRRMIGARGVGRLREELSAALADPDPAGGPMARSAGSPRTAPT